ncbi:MAG: hypothetical protein JWN35_1411 [Frankiales bacterium]|jgi:hypothetical protein|nr:hypothetical protein [Frankiales bacterium]
MPNMRVQPWLRQLDRGVLTGDVPVPRGGKPLAVLFFLGVAALGGLVVGIVLSFPLAFLYAPQHTGMALPFLAASVGAGLGVALGAVTLWNRRARSQTSGPPTAQ